jgi:hypothetical protein
VPLVEHWDGSSWQLAPSPANQDTLEAVAGSGPNDVWAGGNRFEPQHPTIGHWDGTSWVDTRFAVPKKHPVSAWDTTSVAALSPSSAWAVGDYNPPGGYRPFVEHWNGSRWKFMAPLPDLGDSTSPYDVSATAADDVWVVGERSVGKKVSPFIAHWDGLKWSTQTWPVVGHSLYALSGVTAIAPDDVWAVGEQQSHVLALHWDGDQWNVDLTADPPKSYRGDALTDVDAVDSDHAFAVGWFTDHHSLGYLMDFEEGWDGTSWNLQP